MERKDSDSGYFQWDLYREELYFAPVSLRRNNKHESSVGRIYYSTILKTNVFI